MTRKALSAKVSLQHDVLAGVGVIATRPVGGNQPLTRRIRALGGQAIALPGLSLRAVDDPKAAARTLVEMRKAYAVIFVSPAAVRYAWRLKPSFMLSRNVRLFAVGAATARALMRHGVHKVYMPQQRQDSEGLLALPELKGVRGRRICIVAAADGRDLLASTLRQRGAAVDKIVVYQRLPPRLNKRHFDGVVNAPHPCYLLLSSAEALRYLEQALPLKAWQRLLSAEIVVSSARLMALAKLKGFVSIIVARSANATDMLVAVALALGRHKL